MPTGSTPGDPAVGSSSTPCLASARPAPTPTGTPTCRVIGTANSVQAYWAAALPRPRQALHEGDRRASTTAATQSACGTASNQVGPFYCPLDKKVYIDACSSTSSPTQFGADDGALAQEYVVAHEYGHHIQDILGLLDRAQQDPQGATSGVGAHRADGRLPGRRLGQPRRRRPRTRNGKTVPQAADPQDIESALSAASAVGDDRIQQQATGPDQPGHLDPRLVGRAPALVHHRLPDRRPGNCDTFSATSL